MVLKSHVYLGKASTCGVAFPDYEVREIYANDGKELSFATAALVYQERLLVGTVDPEYCFVSRSTTETMVFNHSF